MSALAEQAIILADRDGVIQVWSRGAELVLGHTAEDAIGRSLDMVVPETHREWHWAGYRRAMEAGVSKYDGQIFVDPMLHGDGTIHDHRGRLYLVKDPDGTVVGVMTIWTASATEPGDSIP